MTEHQRNLVLCMMDNHAYKFEDLRRLYEKVIGTKVDVDEFTAVIYELNEAQVIATEQVYVVTDKGRNL